MPRSKALNIEALLAALKEQSNNGRPGVTPSAFATNAYLADQPLSDEQSREQDILDAGNKRYLDTRAADSKRQSDIADAEAADVLGRFNSRTGVQEDTGIVGPRGPKAFTPENFPPVASHAQPALRTIKRGVPDVPTASDRADVSTEFGTSPQTLRIIRRFSNTNTPVDPDAARTDRQKAMDSPAVIAAGLNADARTAAAGIAANKPKTQNIPATTQDALAGINVAEVEGVKVLRALKDSGLDQSNDPFDPRWQKFAVTTLKINPGDYQKADIQQRTAMINAVLTRGLMGGRPSQYVAEMVQQHMPQGDMTGQQLHHVLSNVLEQANERRQETAHLFGKNPDDIGPASGEGYGSYLKSSGARGGNIKSITPIP